MSTKVPGYDDTVICPYNKCHVILRSRIQTHVIQCALSYPHMKLEKCPFNPTHLYKATEMERHLEECSSRESYDRMMYKITNDNELPVEPARRPDPPQNNDIDEENWDNINVGTYDPERYVVTARVLRSPKMSLPSERKKFADSERRRLGELDSHPKQKK